MMASVPTTYDLNEPSDRYQGYLKNQRNGAYKFGILLVVLAFIFFVTGFSTCNWMQVSVLQENKVSDITITLYGGDHDDNDDNNFSLKQQTYSYGLWNRPDDDLCNKMCSNSLMVAQVVFTFCLVGYIGSFAMVGYENCRLVDLRTYHSRRVELMLFFTGAFCCGGLFAFTHLYSTSIMHKVTLTFMWSVFLVSLSSTMLFIAWLLLLCGNRKPGVGVVVSGPPSSIPMTHISCHPSQGAVIRTGPHPLNATPMGYKPAMTHPGHPMSQEPLLPPYTEPPPAYSLPPPYPTSEPMAAPPYYSAPNPGTEPGKEWQGK